MSIRRLLSSPSAQIAFGLMVGQAFVLGVTPLLTRLYSREEMGTAAVILAIAGIATAVGTLRVELLLPTADAQFVRSLCRIGATAVVLVAVTTAVSVWLWADFSSTNAILLAAIIVAMGATALTLQLAARRSALGGVAAAKASQGIVQGGTQLAAGAGSSTSFGMPLGYALGYGAAAVTQYVSLRRRKDEDLAGVVPSAPPRQLVGRMVLLTGAALINAMAVSALPLLVQLFFGEGNTGELAVAQRFAVTPAGLLVAVFLPVVAAQLGARIRRGQGTADAARRWLVRLTPIGLVAGLTLALVPKDWVEFALGAEWGGVADYMHALAIGIGFQIAVGPLGQVLALQGRAITQLIWDCSRLAALLIACASTATLTNDPVAVVFAGSGVLGLSYLVYVGLLFSAKRRDGQRYSGEGDA